MLQVVQNIRSGVTSVQNFPAPIAPPGHVVVTAATSLVSAGTERYIVELARKSLLAKARERPDHVKRVLQKLRQEGVKAVATQVVAKLDEPMPLGYSSAGVVLECGRGVSELKPGDRVAFAGPHAEVVAIGRNLCAPIPEGVTFDQASYAGVGAIALEGVRLAKVSLGERVLVIGLGLIGQLTVAMLKAQGCSVFGIDLDPAKLEQARKFGADSVASGAPRDLIMAFSDSFGVDAVIITAATDSNGPIELAAEVTRTRGRIVLVGVAGLNLPRPPFFAKELEFTVSCSLGPGRMDPSYEEKGIDYPIGYARWTTQRNMRAVLELIGAGKLPVDALTTHRYSIERASEAYDLITQRSEAFTGILLSYPQGRVLERRVPLRGSPTSGKLGIGMVGAGNFVRLFLAPALTGATALTRPSAPAGYALRGICTARGMNAVSTGEKFGFAYATTELDALLDDRDTHAMIISTRHDLHAEMVVAALRAGKHVFVEKPLCITTDELTSIAECVRELGDRCPILMVGFNRRFTPTTKTLREHFRHVLPLSVAYRFASGAIPKNAWPQDEEVGGGRLVGESCHAIDMCTMLTGSPPVRVFAESVAAVGGLETTDDRAFITVRHENGSISNVSYQSGGDRAASVERIEVFGGGRTATVEDWDRIDLWSNGSHRQEKGGKEKGHSAELEVFLEACRKGGPWPIPWEHLYAVSWASLMAVQSIRDGLPHNILAPPEKAGTYGTLE